MKKYIICILCAMAMLCSPLSVQHAAAQDDVMKQAMEGYKNLTSMTANVKKTVHNEMVAKDQVTTGMFYFKKPAKVCITTNGGKDKLMTDGETFTIVQDGKKSTASGKGNSSLSPLINAIKGITSGKEVDLSDVADVDVERGQDKVVMTIAPIVQKAADKRKMLYQSFVITVDTKAGELRSIRLNGKGKNYEVYELTGYKHDVKIDDSVFK